MSITTSDVRPGQPSPVRAGKLEPRTPPPPQKEAFHWTCVDCATFNVTYATVDDAGNIGPHVKACVKCGLNHDGPLVEGDQWTDPNQDAEKFQAEFEARHEKAARIHKAQTEQIKAERESKGPERPGPLPPAPQAPAPKPAEQTAKSPDTSASPKK